MTRFSALLNSSREDLPEAPLERWASGFFSASVLTLLISLAAAQIFLAAAAAAYAVHLLHGRPKSRGGLETRPGFFPPVKLPLALFCLFTVTSLFWAANPGVGWLAVRKLPLFLVWLLALNLIVSPGHLVKLFQGLFLESALAGLVAAGQFVLQYRAVLAVHSGQVYYYLTADRVRGFMGHWMHFGGQQMMVFAGLLAFLLLAGAPAISPASRDAGGVAAGLKAGVTVRPNKSWWLVLAAIAISIGLNFTRGVWLGCFVAVVYLVARAKPRWLLALPVVLLAGYFAAPTLVRQRIESLRHPSRDPSLSIRFEMWQVALRMIERHPLVGIGPNNIEQEYPLYLEPGRAPEVGYHEHFHSNFLQFAAERGLPCLAAWVWLMAALAWEFVRTRRRLSPDGRSAWVADGALAAWLAFVFEGCFEFNFGSSPVLMLFLFVTATPFVAERLSNVER